MNERADKSKPGGEMLCPVWLSWTLSNPLRRAVHKPEQILEGIVKEGDTVVDLGCGPGFFTVPVAHMVGERGQVIAVDLQLGMLQKVRARAEREGVLGRIVLHQCSATDLGVTEKADVVLAIYMAHEVPDVADFMRQVRDILSPGGRFVLVEPIVHVSRARFARTLELAEQAGMKLVSTPKVLFSQGALLEAI